jgi:hypothetical protein
MAIKFIGHGIRRRPTIRFALLICIVFIFLSYYLFLSQSQLRQNQYRPLLSGYSQDEKSLTVSFNSIEGKVFYVTLPRVPDTLDVESLRKESLPVDPSANKVLISLANEPLSSEYSIILFIGGDYVELVRQSSLWLKSNFNFDRPGGYSILGRRSLETNFSSVTARGPLSFVDRPKTLNIDPVDVSTFKEINYAAGLLRMMWAQPIQQGPTATSYTDFLEQPFEEKMRRVRSGEFAVMCQGFRDLFVHASTATPQIKIRPVEAYNYSPQIPDLITYGHSTAEIWVEEIESWVLFDPWLGIIVTQNGIPIGAEELGKVKDFGDIAIVPVIESVPRMYRKNDGQVVYNQFLPSTVKAAQFSCNNLGCSPGYSEYFRNIEVREYQLKTRQGE